MVTTRPKLVGLKICLPCQRSKNLPKMAAKAAVIASSSEFVRNKRQSESPEIKALFGSNAADQDQFMEERGQPCPRGGPAWRVELRGQGCPRSVSELNDFALAKSRLQRN